VEALEHHAHIVPAEPGKGILAQRGQVLAEDPHGPAGGTLEPAEQHEE